jgi:fumarate hydratase class II
MDATPPTVGQVFWLCGTVKPYFEGGKTPSALIRSRWNCRHRLNTPLVMMLTVAKNTQELGHPSVTAENKFEALAAHDAIVESHGAKTISSFH